MVNKAVSYDLIRQEPTPPESPCALEHAQGHHAYFALRSLAIFPAMRVKHLRDKGSLYPH